MFVMETKIYNPKLRALLSVRNFNKALEGHLEQMKQIEKSLDNLFENALTIIKTYCTEQQQERWIHSQKDVSFYITSIDRVLKSLKEKIANKNKSDSSDLWNQFSVFENNLNTAYKASEKIGFEILPMRAHKDWQKDICIFEDTIMKLIISYADSCKLELEMIEKYTPQELDQITQIIADHIPAEFTFHEADKYEKEYLKAFEEMKKEFSDKKNLWDKFLDILAGGTHQPPSERVMMKRWLEGVKEPELE